MRLDWIDICKAIAIFAMVFCHVGLELPSQNAALSNWIHLWHMPIFFILSGIVLNKSKYLGWSNFKSFLVNRLKTLILPYFCFGFICMSIGYVLNIIVGLGGLSVKEILLAFVINNERIPYGGIQWFLTALFFCELFYVVVANIIGTKKITIIVFLLFWLVGFFCRYLDGSVSSIPFSILPAIFATPFFAIGFLFKDKIKNFVFNHCWNL